MKEIAQSIKDKLTHKNVSFAKSGLRFLAGLFLIGGNIVGAGFFIILAEVLGIYEETV